MENSLGRKLAAAAIVAAGFCVVAGVYIHIPSDRDAAERDFISYWAAGQQLAHGANPYDLETVQRMEIAVGRAANEPRLVMRNLPIALFLAWPLGYAGPKTSLVFWLLALLVILSVSLWLLWRLNGRPDNRFHLLGFVFAPVPVCLMAGQVGIFLLFGVVLFLYFHRSRPFFGGAALLFCAIKPHLFLPFGVALLLWVVYERAYRVLTGFLTALAASCAISFCLDPHAWSQYSQMMKAGGALNEIIPVLSAVLRLLVDPDAVWLQFLPQVCACAWAIWYFWTRRSRWSWLDHGLLLLLVSAMCTPFGWLTDETMLFPAVLAGLYRAVGTRRSLLPLGLIAGAALIEVLAGVPIVSFYYLWTTPAWLGWYLFATGRIGSPVNQVTRVPAPAG